MAFSPLGMVLGAALTRDMQDRARASQIEILGGVLGGSPMGLVLMATMAGPDVTAGPPGDGTPREAEVPNVQDASDVDDAGHMLRAHGLALAGTTGVVSENPIGAILGSTPEAGAFVLLGTSVTVLTSAGMIVPSVVTLTVDDAKTVLATAGFTAETKNADTPKKPGTVLKQSPEAGSMAEPGSSVTIYVNAAGKSTTSGSPSSPTS